MYKSDGSIHRIRISALKKAKGKTIKITETEKYKQIKSDGLSVGFEHIRRIIHQIRNISNAHSGPSDMFLI